jgi:hypothetical protein
MILDMTPFPKDQLQFCDLGRKYFDFDIVDENMIDWGMLNHYKVLIQTSGEVFRGSTLQAISKWLEAGGVLITNGSPHWESLESHQRMLSELVSAEDSDALPGMRIYRMGRGRLYEITALGIQDYVKRVNDALALVARGQPQNAPINGYHGKDDGTYVTDFPDGRLLFDTKTLATTFVPKVAPAVAGTR